VIKIYQASRLYSESYSYVMIHMVSKEIQKPIHEMYPNERKSRNKNSKIKM
jgi:hypothetical protein